MSSKSKNRSITYDGSAESPIIHNSNSFHAPPYSFHATPYSRITFLYVLFLVLTFVIIGSQKSNKIPKKQTILISSVETLVSCD